MEREAPQVHLQHSPTRCPYCHDDIAAEEVAQALVCQQCLARHHRDCWEGACANCAHERALGELAAIAAQPREGDPTVAYERIKRWVNRGFAIAFVLHFLVYVLVSFMAIPGGRIAMLALTLVISLLWLPLVGIDIYDALVRRKRDERTGWLPVGFSLAGVCSGGVTSFCYYLRWGHRPLPRPPGEPEQRPDLKGTDVV